MAVAVSLAHCIHISTDDIKEKRSFNYICVCREKKNPPFPSSSSSCFSCSCNMWNASYKRKQKLLHINDKFIKIKSMKAKHAAKTSKLYAGHYQHQLSMHPSKISSVQHVLEHLHQIYLASTNPREIFFGDANVKQDALLNMSPIYEKFGSFLPVSAPVVVNIGRTWRT